MYHHMTTLTISNSKIRCDF